MMPFDNFKINIYKSNYEKDRKLCIVKRLLELFLYCKCTMYISKAYLLVLINHIDKCVEIFESVQDGHSHRILF